MHAYIHTCIHTHTHTYTHACIHTPADSVNLEVLVSAGAHALGQDGALGCGIAAIVAGGGTSAAAAGAVPGYFLVTASRGGDVR